LVNQLNLVPVECIIIDAESQRWDGRAGVVTARTSGAWTGRYVG
jgi:hypothetical protein